MSGALAIALGSAGLVLLAMVVLAWTRTRGELARLRRGLEQRPADPTLGLIQQQVSELRETLSRRLESGQSRLDQRFDALSATVGDRIEASRKTLDQRLESTTAAVREVHRSLGEVDRSVKNVSEITRDIRALQDILKAPKLRGGLGEFFLGDLLAQIFPPSHYKLQHEFDGGERVDAVIRAGDRLVPVDAKFPMEQFRRMIQADSGDARRKERRVFMTGLHRHVDDIASKYIRPDEGTYDFALMYIPAENIYYEAVLRDEDLGDTRGALSYALSRRVIPVSPNSFYAYLQVILIGLQGMRIEARTRQILEKMQSLRGDVHRFAGEFATLGKHIGNARARFEDTGKSLDRLTARLESLAALGDGKDGEAAAVDGPGTPALQPPPVSTGDAAPGLDFTSGGDQDQAGKESR